MSISRTLLKTLGLVPKKGKELERLKKFVHFQKDQNAVGEVFDFLMLHYDTNFKTVTNEMVLQIITTTKKENSKINDGFLRVYYSNLNGLIEQFFIHEELKNDIALQQQLLAKAYTKKKQSGRFKEATEAAQKELEISLQKNKIELIPFHFQQVILGDSLIFHPFMGEKNDSTLLKKHTDILDKAFVLQKLKFMLRQLFHSRVYNQKSEQPLFNAILHYCEEENQQSDAQIRIYANVIKLYKKNLTISFSALCDDFKTNYKEFNLVTQRQLFVQIQNDTTQRINEGDAEAFPEALSWFKFGIDSKLLLENEKLSETSFLNIANTAAICRDYDWFDFFIKTYKSNLDSASPLSIIGLCRANCLLVQYEQTGEKALLKSSISTLNEIKRYTLFQKITFYLLKIKQTYYLYVTEQCIKDDFENCIKAFDSFIKRDKKLSESRKEVYHNFSDFVCKLVAIKDEQKIWRSNQLDQMKISLIKQINEAKVLNKKWLLDRLSQK
jgi:hypothetical protein